MVRQAHHLTTLSKAEGQITMTEIQNSKQWVFDLICNLVLVICYFRFIRVGYRKLRFAFRSCQILVLLYKKSFLFPVGLKCLSCRPELR